VLHVLTLDGQHREIRLHARGIVETDDSPPAPDIDDDLPPELFLRGSALTAPDAAVTAFANRFAEAVANDRLAGLNALLQALADVMPYTPGQTDVFTSAAVAFAHGQGVCQDHAHVFIACARRLGIAARYVSGYLATDTEHVASHAWAEAWMGAGWLGFDVSNRCLAGNRYVKLAAGMDYLDACPVRGVRQGGGIESMHAVARVGISDQ
jgi:transglutaminase-like putative cysteine protease